MKKILNSLLALMTFFSTSSYADFFKGKVIDISTREPIYAATIRIIFIDNSETNCKTNSDGQFEYNSNQNTLMIITNAFGYLADTINFIQFDKNDHIILLEDKPTFICSEPTIYKEELTNSEFEFKIKGHSTTNFVDSLNRRQGRWLFTQNDKYDKDSKYSYGATMSIGYYRDNNKVGKWLIINPDGKIERTILYDE
jgi:hypothetical protein